MSIDKNKTFLCVIIVTAIFFVLNITSCTGTKENINTFNNAAPAFEDETEQEIVAENPGPVMVPWEDRILNIFFHPLVARPEQAFRSAHRTHFMEWYITAYEYQKILYEMYLDNYVLIDIKELYEVRYEDGSRIVSGKIPLVPEGRKPMILSIDDLSYYDFVRENASIHKLVIDEHNGIAGWTDGPNGGVLSYDLDVVTYLEEFIKMYPDFSLRGARGIIALTGYEGVLGYRTHELSSPVYQREKENVMLVVERLKELGWHFASHSWGHPNLPNISMDWFMRDTDRWDREVRPVIGDTDLFIYPFGAAVEDIEARHSVLRNRGFVVFFGVGTGYGYREMPNYIYYSRRSLDGVYFRVFRGREDSLFDVNRVLDPQRR